MNKIICTYLGGDGKTASLIELKHNAKSFSELQKMREIGNTLAFQVIIFKPKWISVTPLDIIATKNVSSTYGCLIYEKFLKTDKTINDILCKYNCEITKLYYCNVNTNESYFDDIEKEEESFENTEVKYSSGLVTSSTILLGLIIFFAGLTCNVGL